MGASDRITWEADMFAFGMVVIEVRLRTHPAPRIGAVRQKSEPHLGLHGEVSIQRSHIWVRYWKDHQW